MKKFLLPIAFLMLSFAGANAQSARFSAPLRAQFGSAADLHTQLAAAPAATASHKAARAEASEGNLEYLFVEGADVPAGALPFKSSANVGAVFGHLTADKLAKYGGYTIVGVGFMVGDELGEQPSLLVYEDQNDTYQPVAGGYIDSYTVSSQEDGFVLNEVGLTDRYTLPETPGNLIFGYSFTLSDDATNSGNIVLVGQTPDYENGLIALAAPQGSYSLYRISSADAPYALCVQLILQKGDNTAVVGIDGNSLLEVKDRFAADGTRLNAPVKGLNIERLADGTVRKVMVR